MITLHTLGSMLGGLPISISAGGTHNIAHALQRALMEEGGDFFVLSEVTKILIEGNRATGIRLADGTEIEAKKMVVCDNNVYQVVNKFIGHEHTPASIVEKVKKVHSDMGAWWFWATYYQLPKYLHEANHPECLTQRQYMMPLKPDWFRYEQYEEFKKGMLPKYIYFHISHPSYFDPRYAPEGHHSSVVEFYGPPVSYVGVDWYDTCDPAMIERVIEQWQWYAPNMTKDNFIAWHNTSVRDMADKLWDMPNGCWTQIDMTNDQMGQRRPIPEYSRYKTHLDNVYMCSSTMHPGGALHGICGYNAYKRIAEDYGLEKPWEKAGRPF
jgi:phytoene dehydrogenase-like protein